MNNLKWLSVKRKLDDLKDYEKNPRTMSKHDFDRLVKSLKENGYHNRLLVDTDNTIIGGHMRKKALVMAGLTPSDEVEILMPNRKLTEEEFKRINIQDNLPFGDFNIDMLANNFEIEELKEWGMPETWLPDVKKTGLTDDDEVPEVEKPKSKQGDIWILGNHRLMCGDSTSKEAVDKLVNNQKVDMVFTDPPYGMNLNTDWSKLESKLKFFTDKDSKGRGTKYNSVIGDNQSFSPDFILKNFNQCKEIFLWGADYYSERLINKNEGSWVVWDKRVNEQMDKIYGSSFELCWSKNKHRREIARITWAGCFGHNKKIDGGKRSHPTQKPVNLAEWFFDKWGKGLINIVDLYGGSGSTLIACEKTDRKCFMMELNEYYCDVIINRWQNYTGKEAVLESTGELYNSMDLK